MASHARPRPSRIPRPLLQAGLTVSAAGAALVAGGTATAHAAVAPTKPSEIGATAKALTGALGAATGPIKGARLDPLAKTPVDPFTNGIGAQIADFKPISTTQLTRPLTTGGGLEDVPVVGAATKVLPG